MAATNGSIFASSAKAFSAFSVNLNSGNKSAQPLHNSLASNFTGNSLSRSAPEKKTKSMRMSRRVSAVMSTEATSQADEVKDFVLPSWTMFELGRAPVYWKTMNGLPPTSGERLRIFYNPTAKNIPPNNEFGIAFNGGFNQPIMCGGEPRVMKKTERGVADSPIYSIQICIPKHALNLIFSFTNGAEWDGPYRLQFQVPKGWKNKPIEFFNKGLGDELSLEGACDRAIFPDAKIVADRCAIIGNLTLQGADRCELNLVPGCTDPASPEYDPLANVDDGSCPVDLED